MNIPSAGGWWFPSDIIFMHSRVQYTKSILFLASDRFIALTTIVISQPIIFSSFCSAWTMITSTIDRFRFRAFLTIIFRAISISIFRLKIKGTFQTQIRRHFQCFDPWYISVRNVLRSHFTCRFVLECTIFLMNWSAGAATTRRGDICRSQYRWWFTIDGTIPRIVQILRLILWILIDLYGKLRA